MSGSERRIVKRGPEIVGTRTIAAGTQPFTLVARAAGARLFTHYVWQGSRMVPNVADKRCRAVHPDSELQCDWEAHDGDEHEFNNPVSWVACAQCGGGPEYHPEFGGEVIAHMVDCPCFEDAE